MINILYCVDRKLLDQQVLSLISLAKHTKEPLNVINLTVEVPEYNAKNKKFAEKEDELCTKILQAANPESKFRSVDVSDLFREKLLFGPNLHNKYYSYYVTVRLLAYLVKEVPDKVLYLDSDTIFCDDVKKVWDFDVSDCEYAGRRDAGRITKYIQSGVMLMNMKMIRESGAGDRACYLCTHKKYICYLDMSSLNSACKKRKVFTKKFNSYQYTPDCVIHHVCATREGKIPLTKKWWHRIKTDECEFMRKIYPQYSYIYDELDRIKAENKEIFEK